MNLLGLVDVPTWLIFVLSLVYAYYKYITWTFGTFEKLGIPGPKPYPIIGNLIPFFKKGIMQWDCDLRKEYGKLVGVFQGRDPILMVYDLEILKQVMVKKFYNFPNRRIVDLEYPLNTWLTVVQDEQWKRIRNSVTPAFSGSKLRRMTAKINNCAITLSKSLAEKAKTGETINFREYSGYFALDVIASTAFGLEVNSQEDPSNPFVHHVTKAFVTEVADPRMIIMLLMPALLKYLPKLGLSLFPKDSLEFFESVVTGAVEKRNTDPADHKDLLQMMINAHMGNPDPDDSVDVEDDSQWKAAEVIKEKAWTYNVAKGLTREEVLGQSMLFFLAGFETTALTLAYVGYNLALNPDCQETLIEEIDTVMGGKDTLDYDVAKDMPYLTMCIEETMRLYPAGARMDRTAGEDITINGLFIPKGIMIGIPIYAIHHDPDLWEDPEKFDPERFRPEAKAARDPFAYMPFGMGPRNCMGMRMALLELKVALTQILRHYKFVRAPETEVPVTMIKVTVKAVNGIKLRLEARQ